MNCRDAERLVDTFFDGELDGRLMREAALHVTRCKRCESEIVARERIHDLLGAAVEDEIAAMDTSRIWSGVEAAIGDALPRRRGEGVAAGWLRLAAASTRVRGVIVGGKTRAPSTRGRALAEDDLDPSGQWLLPRSPAPRWSSWSLAGTAALAASLVAIVLLGRGDSPIGAPIASTREVGKVPEAVAMVSPAARQVQVESVDYEGRSLAMWTEPETDTTVIWVEDEEPGAAK